MSLRSSLLALPACLALLAAPCQAQDAAGPDHDAHEHGARAHVAEFVAVDYAIEAPDTVPAGWTTLRFVNQGHEVHFVFLVQMPEGKTARDYEAEVYPVFVSMLDALNAGEVDPPGAIGMLMDNAPEWLFATVPMGGPGLTAPGQAIELTLNLEPGQYVVECYMKTEEGHFHAMEGMVRPLVVTEESSPTAPPEATLHLTISNEGMELAGDLTPGRHLVAVHFAEQPEMGPPHDVNVARLDDDADVETVVSWMNWMAPHGLMPPAPAKFVGGARPMVPGQTAYMTLDLEPGRYLFVSEATAYQGVVKEVRVTAY